MKYKNNGQWEEITIKALDSMPVGSIVDYDGQVSDIPVGWEQVNDYSTTDEIDTGKTWIDGKEIYRKVLTGSVSGTGKKTITHNIQNISNVINANGSVYTGLAWYLLPMSGATDNISGYSTSLELVTSTSIILFIGTNLGSSSKTYYIILEYTKTTNQE